MYYDQLLAMREKNKLDFRRVFNDNAITSEYKDKRLRMLIERDSLIEAKLRLVNYTIRTGVGKAEAEAYKKAFKHEFLTQIKAGYAIEDILTSIDELIPNPGLNPRNYVKALRNAGYFYYFREEDEQPRLILSAKAERYLENEANISLKRK